MDRQTVFPGQILPETTLLNIAKDSMIGLAKLSAAIFGVSTMANGFAVTPTGPASLQVVVAPGELYSLTAVDGTAWSSLAADTTHSIVKQGIALDSTTLTCAAPTTNGQSISYLIQASYLDLDATPVLLPYYNSANPSQPYSGQGNNGLTQNTVRKGTVVLQAKAGASAATGSQVTPSPDAGYVGLYVVTVAYGQTATTAANIARYSAAPLLASSIIASIQNGGPSFAVDTGAANTYVCAFAPAITARAEGQVLRFKVKTTNTGASTFNDGAGALPLVGGAHSALQGGEMLANGNAWVQFNSSVGSGSYVLLFCTGAPEQVAPAAQSGHAIQLAQMAAVVGGVRNGRMTVAVAAASATYTADEIAVKSALGGVSWLLTSFNKTINLAVTGAGGMDTGTAQASGFVALYAIYNPTTATSALLAVNATAAKAPEAYSGANMPAGYTASCLLTVVPTGAVGTIAACSVRDREVHISSAYIYTTNAIVTATLVTATIVPLNAVTLSGTIEAGCTAASQVGTLLSDGDAGAAIGQQSVIANVIAGGNAVSAFRGIFLTAARQIAVTTAITGSGTATYRVACSGYTI